MTSRHAHRVAVMVAAGLAVSPVCQLHAAESYDNCTGFIDSVPATIATQGTWCLRRDLSTTMTSGNAIAINTNNVTIDCNGFKLGGLAAGEGSMANGIRATNRWNATVRHCAIRGFLIGIDLDGSSGGGHLVEDNRLDGNLMAGVFVQGDDNLVQRNRVLATGGSDAIPGSAWGISVEGDVLDNTVSGVHALGDAALAVGIAVSGGTEARDNRVRDVVAGLSAGSVSVGIDAPASGTTVAGNRLRGLVGVHGVGIRGNGAATFCVDNTVYGFEVALEDCERSAGNLSQ
jgi:hypothetical protein